MTKREADKGHPVYIARIMISVGKPPRVILEHVISPFTCSKSLQTPVDIGDSVGSFLEGEKNTITSRGGGAAPLLYYIKNPF